MKTKNLKKNIPPKWKLYKIDDVSSILKGKGLSKSLIVPNGENKCILYGQLFTTYDEVIKSVVSRTNSSEGVLSQKGDILLPGSTTTKAIDLAVASALLEDDILLGGDINILRQKNGFYDPIFFAYYLTHYKKKEIGSLGQGTTIVHLYGKNLKNIKVALPPLSEQKKIAEILEAVDNEIKKNEELISATEKLKTGLVIGLMSDPSKVSKSRIGDIAEVTSSKRVMVKDYVEQGIPFYRSTEIIKRSKNIPIDNFLYISTDKFNEFKTKFGAPMFGDLLVTAVGTIGDVYLVKKDDIFYFKDGNSVWIRKIVNTVLPEYLKTVLASKFYRDKLNNIAGGSSQKALTIQKLERVEIPIPSILEQERVIRVLSIVDDKITLLTRLKSKLSELKKGLMSDLLSGRKIVNNLLK